MGLVHMNGRVEDAITGRFLSPDVFIQDWENTQNFNRFAYVVNNPMTLVDPTGHSFVAWVRSLANLFGFGDEDNLRIVMYDDGSYGVEIDGVSRDPGATSAPPPDNGNGVSVGGDPLDSTPGNNGGGGGTATPQTPEPPKTLATCDSELPGGGGQTIGDFVRNQRARLQMATDILEFTEPENTYAAISGMFWAIVSPNGPIDFKNNLINDDMTLAQKDFLGEAGNFAFWAIGVGFISNFDMSAGAGAYARVTNQDNPNNPFSMNDSAARTHDSALASGGCGQ